MVGLTGVFLSTVAAGVASVFGSGVCLTIGAGFSLGVPAEISMLGLSASGIAIGVASVLFESSGRGVGSGRTVGAASWARANGDRTSARPMYRTIWRIPLWTRVDDALRSLPVTSNNRSRLPSAVALTTVIFPFAGCRLFRRFSLLVRLETTGKKSVRKEDLPIHSESIFLRKRGLSSVGRAPQWH